MEQERKIEKWLRSYAKKRRGQAGDSFKLDPATRRILQSEVSHSASPSEDEDDSLSLWQVLRQQWIYLLGFAACIFVIAAFFFQAANTARTRVQMATTSANLREIGAAAHVAAVDNGGTMPATLDALTNGYLSEQELSRLKNGKAITYTAGNMKLSDLPDNAVIAYSKEENNRRGVVFADGSVQYLTETNFARLTNSRELELAYSDRIQEHPSAPPPPDTASAPNAMPAGPAPAMTPPTAAMMSQTGRFGGKPGIGGNAPAGAPGIPGQKMPQVAVGGELDQSFAATRQIESLAQSSFKNTIAPPAPAQPSSTVLMNFQVSQNGNVIRVVDQDGSVYSGTLQAPAPAQGQAQAQTEFNGSTTAGTEGIPEDKVQQNNAAGAGSTIESPGAGLARALNGPPVQSGHMAPPLSGYEFRVEGMNRTLNQSVKFTGTLLEDLSMAKDVQQSFGVTANAAVGAAFAERLMRSETGTNQTAERLPWSRLRITGTAVINETNRIEINATPVPQMKKVMNN